jgi:low temperature requirement protein LtrA
MVVGGPALFLAGHLWFKGDTFGHCSTARPVALVAFALVAVLGSHVSPLLLSATTTLIVAGVVVWDVRMVHRFSELTVQRQAEETVSD